MTDRRRLSGIDGPWVVGPAMNEVGFVSIYSVNTGVGEARRDGELPKLLTLTFEFEETRPDGMPTQETHDSLVELEDRIRARLQECDDWVLVARYTTPSWGRTFCFYTCAGIHDLVPLVRPLIKPYQGKVFAGQEFDDTDWQVYGVMKEHAVRGGADVRLVNHLDSMGVDRDADRPIEYVLYFPTEEAALESLRENFESADTEGPDAVGDGWKVLVRLVHPPQIALLAGVERSLLAVCRHYGAIYDGWGTPLTDDEGMEAVGRGFGQPPDGGPTGRGTVTAD